jgi:hypothetical protein
MRLRVEEEIMPAHPPYLQHLKTSNDLRTTCEATRAGFVALALEKNKRATPFIAQARALKSAASQVKAPEKLVTVADIRPALLTAAGLSDKSLTRLQEEDKAQAIQELIQNFLAPAGSAWIEELIYRFLLMLGDRLCDSICHVGDALAQRELTRALISSLTVAGRAYQWLSAKGNVWIPLSDDDADIELHLRGLGWRKGKHPRTLIYNLTVPLVKSNVDLCLFDCEPQALTSKASAKAVYNSAQLYVALGELKGGIDPAGADEHWKTARTALSRIQVAFAKARHKPHTFFIGAAIEKRMAEEIWQQLQEGTLENAANLTNEGQVAAVSRWLCSL